MIRPEAFGTFGESEFSKMMEKKKRSGQNHPSKYAVKSRVIICARV